MTRRRLVHNNNEERQIYYKKNLSHVYVETQPFSGTVL